MKLRSMGMGVALAGLCVMVSGCGKAAEKVTEKMAEKALERQTGGKVDVDLKGDKVKIVTKDGETTATFGDGAQVPKDFPSDVAVYKGAKVEGSVATPDGMMVTLLTKDPAAKVIEFYQSELAKGGWTQEQSVDSGEQKMLSMKKDDRKMMVMVVAQGEESRVMLTVPKPRKQ